MCNVKIVNAPVALKQQIKDACRTTCNTHRSNQPFAFPENFFDLILSPQIDKAFMDVDEKPLRESPVIFAAYCEETFAGYVVLSDWVRHRPQTMSDINIDDIYVVPSFRGKEVGIALLNHVKDLSIAEDWDNLTASVWVPNETSRKLFEKAGFVPQSTAFRFGPDRQARDVPTLPDLQPKSAFIYVLLPLLLLMAAIAMMASW